MHPGPSGCSAAGPPPAQGARGRPPVACTRPPRRQGTPAHHGQDGSQGSGRRSRRAVAEERVRPAALRRQLVKRGSRIVSGFRWGWCQSLGGREAPRRVTSAQERYLPGESCAAATRGLPRRGGFEGRASRRRVLGLACSGLGGPAEEERGPRLGSRVPRGGLEAWPSPPRAVGLLAPTTGGRGLPGAGLRASASSGRAPAGVGRGPGAPGSVSGARAGRSLGLALPRRSVGRRRQPCSRRRRFRGSELVAKPRASAFPVAAPDATGPRLRPRRPCRLGVGRFSGALRGAGSFPRDRPTGSAFE